jgi:hypothetical protein
MLKERITPPLSTSLPLSRPAQRPPADRNSPFYAVAEVAACLSNNVI